MSTANVPRPSSGEDIYVYKWEKETVNVVSTSPTAL